MTDDFYDLLEISPDASQADVKEAFREQVRIYHPDLNDDDRARAQFTALKKAYDILGNPTERKAYDRLGHEDYVAKRTSGLPSPDVWKSSSSSNSSKRSSTTTGTATGSAGTTAGSTGSTAGSSRASSASTSKTTASASTASGSAGGTASASGTGASVPGAANKNGTSTAGGAAARGSSASRSYDPASRSDRLGDNALVRWWQNRNFAVPLIWLSALTYLAGLGHFGLENETALEDVAAGAIAIGGDPAALVEFLSNSRHGVETTVAFVAGFELLEPPVPPTQWYGALAGLVAASLLLVLGVRVFWRRDTWGPVSIDETIIVALALAVATVLVGGPLLTGIVLMPLLFGVVVYRTKQLPAWSPSYAYVCCVLAPGLALVAAAAGYETLLTDLLAFVVVPVLAAIGLPVRVTIRKRFGR